MIEKLLDVIGIQYNDLKLYETALTHSSLANELGTDSNERLEFLGDAVLEFMSSDYLFKNAKKKTEGQMTKTRAKMVCKDALYFYANKINLSKYLRLSNGAVLQKSIIADAVESLIAAIYLDKGINFAIEFFNNHIIKYFDDVMKIKDNKTLLQEYAQADKRSISYKLIKEEGPKNNPTFTMAVFMDEIKLGEGIGGTKKEAEQNAARTALKILVTK